MNRYNTELEILKHMIGDLLPRILNKLRKFLTEEEKKDLNKAKKILDNLIKNLDTK